MRVLKVVLGLAALWLVAAYTFGPLDSPAPALNTSKPVYIASDGSHRPILRTRDGLDRAKKLIDDGIAEQRPDMLRELIACRVPVGTRVSRQSSAGWTAERVIVAEGPDTGCEGFVWSDWLSNSRTSNSRGPIPPLGPNVPPHAR